MAKSLTSMLAAQVLSLPPLQRALLIVPIVASFKDEDFDQLWRELEPSIKPEGKEDCLLTLSMLERWVKEVSKELERRRAERDSEFKLGDMK